MFDAEHPDEALEPDTVERKVESGDKQGAWLFQGELRHEDRQGAEGYGNHQPQRRRVARVAQHSLCEVIEEAVVGARESFVQVAQGTDFRCGHHRDIASDGKRAHQRNCDRARCRHDGGEELEREIAPAQEGRENRRRRDSDVFGFH